MSEKHPPTSLRPARGSRTPEWVPGIFYPIVVAALIGVLVVLQGLREDVAVIKIQVKQHERQIERVLMRVSARPRHFELSGAESAAATP